MEIVALYTGPDALDTALAAGARHLAAAVEGLALVYGEDSGEEPSGWAGFNCARDAALAGSALAAFRREVCSARKPLKTAAPAEPARIWARAKGGVVGFPLEQGGRRRGVALVGFPGEWPRMRSAEVDSTLRQIALILDHHAVSSEERAGAADPSEELLQLSEQLFARDLERIEQEERLQRADQLKNDLIDRMCEELAIPLNGIIETLIAVLAGEHEKLALASREGLRLALDEGQAVVRTLHKIRDLWHIRQGNLALEIQDVNLYQVVEEAIFNVRDALRPGVELERRVARALPKVRTDLQKLNQILFHLLENAVRFTQRGRVTLEVAFEEGQLLCTISDTGIGIAPDDQTQIFDEFFQVDCEGDGGRRGAGLGLTIARALVEALGGALTFASEVGQGSRFCFTLPVTVT